ncbi:MAG: amino acid adenylation domain-containing protein [Acidobacteriota bacterium]
MSELNSRIKDLPPEKLRLLAKRLKQSKLAAESGPSRPPLVPVAADGNPPLTFQQLRLWFLDQLEPQNPFYNSPAALRLEGPLDLAVLKAAVDEEVRRQAILRTTFSPSSGEEPVQIIAPSVSLPLPVISLERLPPTERLQQAHRLAAEVARRPFDLAQGPLLRITVLSLGTGTADRGTPNRHEHWLLLTIHHILADAWSMRILLQELAQLYQAFARGERSPLGELAVQYADFARWQRSWLAAGRTPGEVLAQQLAYWKERLADCPPLLELPADRPRPAVQTYRGAIEEVTVPKTLRDRLLAYGRPRRATLFVTLLAAVKILLYRTTDRGDLPVGATIAGRDQPEVEPLVGFFANTLVLRSKLSAEMSSDGLLAQVREVVAGAFRHQDLPFDRLVEELQPERTLSYSPIFQVALSMLNVPPAQLAAPTSGGTTLSPLELDSGISHFDLTLYAAEATHGLSISLEYSTDLFDRTTILRLWGHLENLLRAIVESPERRLSELDLLTAGERHQLLAAWNDTRSDYPRTSSIHQLFEDWAARTPDAVAVVSEPDEQLTYRELNRRANQLAHHLRGLGVDAEVAVGICLERSVEMVLASLAILKAGGAYVPFDPGYPPERLSFMLADTATPVLVIRQEWLDALSDPLPVAGTRMVCVDSGWPEIATRPEDNPAGRAGPDHLAYAMYTSGSTGRPKGTVIAHRSVIRLVRETHFADFSPDQVFLQFAPISFDAATLEIWGPLLNGGRLVVCPPYQIALEELGRLVERHRVSTLWLTAGLFHQMVEDHLASLWQVRQLLAGGDVLSAAHVRKALTELSEGRNPGCTLINGYGPTENTTFTCCHGMTDPHAVGTSVAIGRPIANTRTHLLDCRLQPVAVGVVGQLCIAGDGLTRCYLNRPALTAATLIPNPCTRQPGERLYQTGDLARYRPDGTIEFLGRFDRQVKVRGFRIELAEIEVVLGDHPAVHEAVVMVESHGEDRRLVAYAVPRQGQLPPSAKLRDFLRTKLPDYMVPTIFVALEALPLTPNGKVDRAALARVALPEPEPRRMDFQGVVPRTPVEEVLAGIWRDLLAGVEQVGVTDSFFELGGHSLLATQMISRVRKALGVELSLRRLFETPTIEALALQVMQARAAGRIAQAPPIRAATRQGDSAPLSFAQERLWFLARLEPDIPSYNIPAAVRFRGNLDLAALRAGLAAVVHRHEALRSVVQSVEGKPVQVILPAPAFARLRPLAPLVDLSALHREQRESRLLHLAAEEARRPFDLAAGPLLRVTVLALAPEEHVVLLTKHHIISDGWSVGVLIRELMALYRAFTGGKPPAEAALPELTVQYADFARWQRGWLSGRVLEQQLEYWRRQLDGIAVLELPTDRPRPSQVSPRGALLPVVVPRETSEGLNRLASGEGATLFMTLHAAFTVLLSRITDQCDVAVGTPIANRNRLEVESLIGFFVNTLVLRLDLGDGTLTFCQLLSQAREATLGAYDHQDMPFEKLVREIQPERNLATQPLFQVMFSLENMPFETLELQGLHLEPLAVESGTAMFDLTLSFTETASGLRGTVEYSRDLFDVTTVRRLVTHLTNLLAGVVTDAEQRLCELPLLSPGQRHQLITEWNTHSRVPLRGNHSLVPLRGNRRSGEPGGFGQRFEEQAARTPAAVAVVAGQEQLSYRELNRRANRLAHHLRGLGVGRSTETVVGICLERKPELLVAILAVFKAGGVYLPLDPSYPRQRLRLMLDDAGVAVLVSRRTLADFPRGSTVRLDSDRALIARQSAENPPLAARPGQAAYVIYTSGSTGQPKGVVVAHRSLAWYVNAAVELFELAPGDRVLQFTSISFDVSIEEIFCCLAGGATLVQRNDAMGASVTEFFHRCRQWSITFATLPAVFWHEMVVGLQADPTALPPSLRLVVVGGQRVEPERVADWRRSVDRSTRLMNAYGPTEATVTATLQELTGEVTSRAGDASIGRPLPSVRVQVCDRRLRTAPFGVPGELVLGGEGVARGYLGHPAASAEVFVPDPWAPGAGGRLYRTGDRIRFRAGGELEFLGRIDDQVKVRGFRVEPGEIEAVLVQHPQVRSAAVVARGDRLAAYVVSADSASETAALREFLRQRLPPYMVPGVFSVLPELPVTSSGKVDRAALPDPERVRPQLGQEFEAARTPMEARLASLWAEVLGIDRVGIHDNFFDLGGHSLLLAQLHGRVQAQLAPGLALVKLFQYPTVATLAEYLRSGEGGRLVDDAGRVRARKRRNVRHAKTGEVAILAMAGRFPGAPDLSGFWSNLRDGVESISFFSREELVAAGVDPAILEDPDYVPACGVLEGASLFDASLFNISPRAAAGMDPQHRLFLESAWQALEEAGYGGSGQREAVGVFAGSSASTYMLHALNHSPAAETLQTLLANDKDYLATRVSYQLNLKGPSFTVQTACSTSLVAVHVACQSLLAGECDLALAGGVSVTVPLKSGYRYQEEGILSPDGHCRVFDAKGRGTVPGNGVGVVVLKRSDEAVAAGDPILAVIKASAINNDGAVKVGYTAPSVEGQTAVLSEALELSGVAPETVGYIEAHGTGTRLGDPIEMAALSQAYGTSPGKGTCAIGSLKSNLGHLDAAAGVAGLIKTVLSLRHRQIPPSLHFEQPNPEIDFAGGSFYVNTELRDWPSAEAARRAAVSSFGLGGTNAHLVLEEAPVPQASDPAEPWQLLVLSARTETALERASANLAGHLRRHPGLNPADVACTLQMGRQAFEHRRAVVCHDLAEAAEALAGEDPRQVLSGVAESAPPTVVFLFPGQGSQKIDMGRELYETAATFRRQVDRCCDLLESHLGLDLRRLLYPTAGQAEAAAQQLRQTAFAQPALFAIEYALARQWLAWGVRPEGMVGHSIGELVAACLAEVFSLEDALALVAVRGRLMQSLPAGAMLSVAQSPEALGPLLGDGLSVAAINGPRRCVVSGSGTAIEALRSRLSESGVAARRLDTSHAFHSPRVEPILESFRWELSKVELKEPRLPFLSNVTGRWIRAAEATDPDYWVRHLRQPVQFSHALEELFAGPRRLLLEVGPGQALSTLARRHPAASADRVVLSSMRSSPRAKQVGVGGSDQAFLLTTLGRLWLAGCEVDWPALYDGQRRHRLALPSYPFERQRYWIEPAAMPARQAGKRDLADWFYAPVWKLSAPLPTLRKADPEALYVLFAERSGLAAKVAGRLVRAGATVVTVRPGGSFGRIEDGLYEIDPEQRRDYQALLTELVERHGNPRWIGHFWSLAPTDEGFEAAQVHGLDSLVSLTRALAATGVTDRVGITVVSDGVQSVDGRETLKPEKATVLGPLRVIPQEYGNLSCRAVDVDLPESASRREEELADQLAAELVAQTGELAIAYRRGGRWIQSFETVRWPGEAGESRRLRRHGVYLLTGGLGRIGLTLAEHLGQTLAARLILLGSSPFPERQEWPEWLESHGEEDPTSRKIIRLQALEEAGAEVLVLRADVADQRQMETAIWRAQERFGEIHGVVHLAASVDQALAPIEETDAETCRRQLRPKAHGVEVLEQVLGGLELDFCVLFSSLSSILGGLGFAAYAAANAFLDAFAHRHNRRHPLPWSSIDWDGWQFDGPSTDASFGRDTARLAMAPGEAVAAFRRVLELSGSPQIAVSTGDLTERIETWVTARPAADEKSDGRLRTQQGTRPQLSSVYVAPSGEIQQTVAEIWHDVLGIEEVGIHDNFFELGGDSLMGIQLISRLRRAFQVQLSLRRLFEAPTIADFEALVSAEGAARPPEQEALDGILSEIEGLSDEQLEEELAAPAPGEEA